MQKPKQDPRREERIEQKILADAYECEERAVAWYEYLEDRLEFPFTAHCSRRRAISPLQPGDEVEVIAMGPAEECRHELFVLIRWEREGLAVPLAQLRPIASSEATAELVADWQYWVDRGYRF